MALDWKDRYRYHEPIIIEELVMEEIEFNDKFIGENSKIMEIMNRTIIALSKVDSKRKVENEDIICLINIIEDLKEKDVAFQEAVSDRYDIMADSLAMEIAVRTGIYGNNSLTSKEGLLFVKKVSSSCNRLGREIEYVRKAYTDYGRSVHEGLETYLTSFKDMFKSGSVTATDEIKEVKSKIFAYKDMCALAENKGYSIVRTNGDHMVYRHKDTKRIVIIPAHTLGTGLMYDIQKQLNKRMC